MTQFSIFVFMHYFFQSVDSWGLNFTLLIGILTGHFLIFLLLASPSLMLIQVLWPNHAKCVKRGNCSALALKAIWSHNYVSVSAGSQVTNQRFLVSVKLKGISQD